jgi:hypothetical protein
VKCCGKEGAGIHLGSEETLGKQKTGKMVEMELGTDGELLIDLSKAPTSLGDEQT